MLDIILLSIYLLSTIWAIISIILFGSRPARSIGWLLIVIVIPFVGVIFYMLFGINRKKFKFFSLNFASKRKLYNLNHKSETIEEFKHKFNADNFSKLGRLLEKSSGFPAIDGNKIKLLKNGKQTFDTIFSEIKKAKDFIHLQYYILEEGKLVDELCDILEKKAKEGVEVRILYDAFGSYGWQRKAPKALKNLGIHIFPILPLKLGSILSTLNYRNHRKIVIIDGKVGFTGGFNVSDKYISDESPLGVWDDLHLQVEGPIVDHLHRVFIKDYYFASNETLLTNKKYIPKQQKAGESLVQLVTGGPDADYLSIMHQYVMLINSAKKNVCIANPYFIPNKTLIEALKMAVLSGVEVNIIVPKKSDSKMAKYSMFSSFEELLEVGINIYMLTDSFSHSKLMIVDEELLSVGSGNFDYRSFEYNFETNILLYDKIYAEELHKDFMDECKDAERLDYERFKNRSVQHKFIEGLAKIFSPLL